MTPTPAIYLVIDNAHAAPDSIQAAKDATAQERATVYQQTGVLIREDGRITFDRPRMAPASIHAEPCRQPGCDFVGTGASDGQAIRNLCAHIVSEHLPPSRADQDHGKDAA